MLRMRLPSAGSGTYQPADAHAAHSPNLTVPEALGLQIAGGDRLSNRSVDIARPVRIGAWSGISARIRIAPGSVVRGRTSISGRGCGNGKSRGSSESQ